MVEAAEYILYIRIYHQWNSEYILYCMNWWFLLQPHQVLRNVPWDAHVDHPIHLEKYICRFFLWLRLWRISFMVNLCQRTRRKEMTCYFCWLLWNLVCTLYGQFVKIFFCVCSPGGRRGTWLGISRDCICLYHFPACQRPAKWICIFIGWSICICICLYHFPACRRPAK